MKLFRIIILIVACITLYACSSSKGTHYITFVNKSKSRIIFQPHFLTVNPTDEDALFQCRSLEFGVLPDTLRCLSAGTHSNWESEMKGCSHLQLLVMDWNIFDKHNDWEWNTTQRCDTIRKYVPVLHCYRLTLEDLQRMNWTVVYPPYE